MRIFAFILLNYLFFLPFGQLSAQEYIVNVQQFGIEEGLFNREVGAAFKDDNGLLWMGNDNARLMRYDGYEFKSYKLPDFLKEDHLINQDEARNLVIVSPHGTEVGFLNPFSGEYIFKEERWGEEIAARYDAFIPRGDYWYVHFSENKSIVYGFAAEGLFSIDLLTGEQKLEMPSQLLEGVGLAKILLIDTGNNLWIDVKGETFVINPKKKTLRKYNINPNQYKIHESKGEFYLLKKVNLNSQEYRSVYKLMENGEKQFITEIPEGLQIHRFAYEKLWCIGDLGWQVFDLSGAFLFELKKEEYDEMLFRAIDFMSITSYQNGKYYLSTGFGFNIVEVKKNPFTKYFADREKNQLPINNAARNIHVHNDSIIVIFEAGGIVSLAKDNPSAYQVILSKSQHPQDTFNITSYTGRTILQDSEQNIWTDIATKLVKWSPDFSQKKAYNALDSPYETVWSLYEDENGCIWGGYEKGLKRICSGETELERFYHSKIGFGFDNLLTYQIQQGEDGHLWLCTDKGLFIFDTTTKKFIAHFHEDASDNFAIPVKDIFFMHTDEDKNRWLGTRSGLVFWNTSTDEKRLFTRDDGLSNEVIYAVFEDEFNQLWLSSDYGIMSFDKETFDVQTYLPKDGVAQKEFNRISHFQEPDGTIYFGGLNGITAFHPKDFVASEKEYARMAIADYEIFDGEVGKLVNKFEQISNTKTIIFHPDDRFFRLKFALLTFEKTSRIVYGWKVDGVDDDWNYQKENSLQIGVLPYGSHTLRIKGQSANGWSPHEITIQVQVLKPFYLQIWFITLSVLAIIAAIYFFLTRKTRLYRETQQLLETEITKATAQITQQTEELKQLDEVKSRFFANVTHELRTPLTLMLGPISSALKSGDLTNRNFTLLKKAQNGGQDLLKLIASILDLSKMEAGKIELRENPEILFRLIRRIVSVFESHAQREGIYFTLNYQAEENLQLELDKDKVEIILNNLLSNAIKFTNKDGKVAVTVEDLKNKIRISVKDTGRGIHLDDLPYVFNRFYQSKQADTPTEGGTGIGLALSQEFVTLMGGKIWVESEFGKGSTFFVEIPRKEVLRMIDATESREDNEPLIATQKAERPASSINISNPTNIPTQTLLVVEDNHSLRDYLKTILEPYYKIITAENGAIALDLLNNITQESSTPLPSLVLSDIMMPKMDGYQLLHHLKEHETWCNIPVIMLTARADIHDKLKALRIGVDDYLLKPFAEEELLARIDNLVKHYEERKAVVSQIPTEAATNAAENTTTIALVDQKWLSVVEEYIKTQISNHHFSISLMATEFAMSESTLLRQLKKITGLTPAKYVQEIRLTEARTLLENKAFPSISEVAYNVGFKDAKAFTRSFKKRFGKTPSEYL